jgi:hypothetical protein
LSIENEELPPPRERAIFDILVAQADSQWHEHNPRYYKSLKASGQLQARLEQAAETTILEMDQLEDKGLAPDQAREIAMQNILLPPE